MRGATFGGVIMASALFTAPAVLACGYHSPQAVALGMLNLTFPNALYVRTAVWVAEDGGVLPPRNPQKPLDMFGFQRTAANLQTFADRLSLVRDGDGEPVSFAVVLIDSLLWTRFVASPDGYAARVHVDGPEARDVIVVTDGKVIKALADGSLNAAQAETHGLLRLYGPSDLQDKGRGALMKATRRANETSGVSALLDNKQ
jgi:hypothetical protein